MSNRCHRMSPIAFVVPVHPPKFVFFCALVHSNKRYANQIFGVFSSSRDAAACPCVANVTSLIVEPDRRNPVTSKKWEAVRRVFRDYTFDAVVAIDAESRFARSAAPQDIVDFLKGIVTYGKRPAVSIFQRIHTHSCRAVNLSAPSVAYLWWGNIPMYTREHFYDFYSSIDTKHLNWLVFDHVAYLCFLAVVKRRPVVHTGRWLESPQCVHRVQGVPLLWVPHRACVNNRTLLTYHHDRFQ